MNHGNKGQSLIGIVIVLVVVGLISGGLYFYLSSQIPEVPEIAEKQEKEEIVPSPDKELIEEESTTPEETTPQKEIIPVCQNDCSQAGLKKCSGNGYQICGNYDTDNCLEWSSITACPTNTICQNGICIQQTQPAQKCADGTLYGQCSTNKPQYCDNGNLVNKASLCGCPSGYKISENQCILDTSIKYKKIGIVYVSESNETYNANWRTDLYSNKSKIENALNDIFSKKGENFVVDFLGEFRANNLCWNPARIAFIQESSTGGGTMYSRMPASELSQGAGNYYCLGNYNYWTTIWSDCNPDRCEEFNNPDLPNQPCFRINCQQKPFVLSLQNLSWVGPFLNDLQSSFSFSDYDYKVIVLGRAGPIIPQTGDKEKHFFDTVFTSGDIMGYYAPSSKIIVMTENGLRIPSYYHYSGEATWTKFFMPGWQQIVHEILHQLGTVDVYKPGYFQQNPNRDEALKLEPESEVDKSIMANGWPGYCNDYQSTYSCTAQDTEKIYLDKFNRIKLGLE
jgi:hypothetical protein